MTSTTRATVRDDHSGEHHVRTALEAKFPFEEIIESMTVFAGESAVDLIVGAHDARNPSLDGFQELTHGAQSLIRTSYEGAYRVEVQFVFLRRCQLNGVVWQLGLSYRSAIEVSNGLWIWIR